ncbi:MAG: class I SAM-dependent methyltransferase [Pseudomonadota bacterium]
MFGWNTQFDYFMCRACGCLQIVTIPADLYSYYPEDYYAQDSQPESLPAGPLRQINWLRLRYRLTGRGAWAEKLTWRLGPLSRAIQRQIPYLERIPDLDRDSRILDIGCGEYSAWLASLAYCGFRNLTGADPFIKHAGFRDGIRYLCIEPRDLQGPYDLITLHHSLEHIPDQHALLRTLERLLAADGACLIRIPLVDSEAWDEYGLDWVELDAPRHLYLHSRNSLAGLAQAHGFEIFDTLCDSTAFEFAGSAQYRMGIPLMAHDSFWNGSGPFDADAMRLHSHRAQAVNAAGRCGRAAFFLRRSAA